MGALVGGGAGLALGAITTREDPADALVSKGDVALADLPQGATVVLNADDAVTAHLLGERAEEMVLLHRFKYVCFNRNTSMHIKWVDVSLRVKCAV